MKGQKWKGSLCVLALAVLVPSFTYGKDNIATSKVYTAVSQIEQPTKYTCPLAIKAEVLSFFGEARSGYFHQGIDLKAEIGTPIVATMDGVVVKASPDSKGLNAGGGNIIMLDHGNGIQTWYMHLADYAVKLGDKVKAGDLIGFTGNSGDSTTPLLHFEYRVNGVPMDPLFIFQQTPVISLNEPFLVTQS